LIHQLRAFEQLLSLIMTGADFSNV